MKTVRFRLLLILTLASFVSSGQRLKKADKLIISNLESHIGYLSADKLEGRRAGTNGEKLAGEYISKSFEKHGLQPKGNGSSWLQPFEIFEGRQVLPASRLVINSRELKLYTEYFPFSFSASKHTEAAVAMALSEKGAPWFMDLKELEDDHKNNPHFDPEETIKTKAVSIAAKGATALIVYNSSASEDLQFNSRDKSQPVTIPVLYITKEAKKKYFSDESANLDISLTIELADKKRTANNVVGYLDNKAKNTIILGAHYDHLGYGEDGNSLMPAINGKQIHNGADDNASGTAAILELARLLKGSKQKSNNYLFIAFSGEELGLFGSKYFTEHPTIDLANVNYMINMDMIGRLNDSSKALNIGGYGTSPSWASALAASEAGKRFSIRYDSSGTGPSDHTSFYRKDIPVLFFFTGLHPDYHRPDDDFNKINYTGEFHIVKYILDIISKTNTLGKLAFSKTREQATMGQARFSVTLGILPDYTFNGTGVRVDGISDGRPAQKAGLQAGDIILQLSGYSASSLELYMKALSNFKKGDKATVNYKRGNEQMVAEVQF